MSHPDKKLVHEVAEIAAPHMLKNCDLQNLVLMAIIWGYKACEKGWNIERAIEEGKKL